MHTLKWFLIISMMSLAVPVCTADTASPENTAAQEKEKTSERAKRPQREAVKLSPHARESSPRPDESGNMKRIAPPRTESPLQNVPALMQPPPGVKPPVNP